MPVYLKGDIQEIFTSFQWEYTKIIWLKINMGKMTSKISHYFQKHKHIPSHVIVIP